MRLGEMYFEVKSNLACNAHDMMCVIDSLIVKRHEAQHRVAFRTLHAAPSLATQPTAKISGATTYRVIPDIAL